MNIFQDIHTYLFISFVLMVILLFKKAYKRLDDGLSKNVNDVKNKISNLENRKKDMDKQLENLKKEIEEANKHIDKAIISAEEEAKKITEKSGLEITEIVQDKQKEYEEAIQKIKSSLSAEMQNRIVKLVIKDLMKKLEKSEPNRDFQNINIDNSTKMLEDLVKKYIRED